MSAVERKTDRFDLSDSDLDVITEKLSRGESFVSIAEYFCVNPSRLRRAMQRADYATGDRPRPFKTLRRAVDDMRPVEAVSFLLDLFEFMTDMSDERVARLVAMGLSAARARILLNLYSRRGMVTTKHHLAVSSHAHDSTATLNATDVVDVNISHIRKYLAERDCPLEIKTIWGVGYLLECPSQWQAPWELEE